MRQLNIRGPREHGPGWSAYVDQCMCNLTTHDDRGQVQPVKKPTCFYTAKKSLAKKISVFCGKKGQECHIFHQPLEGFDPIDKVSRSKAAENYPPYLAQDLAQAMAEKDDGIYDQEDEVDTEDNDDPQGVSLDRGDPPRAAGSSDDPHGHQIVPRSQDDEVITANRELKRKVGSQAYTYVTRLRKNLGHPSPEGLVRMLSEVQATAPVLEAAKGTVCRHCYKRKMNYGVPPAAGLTAKYFGDRLITDSAWIDCGADGRFCILTFLDQQRGTSV